jgi:GlpG protein
MLEERYGPSTICGVVPLSALRTALVNAPLFPNIALCGASGVCLSLIPPSSFTSFTEGEIPLTFILVAVLFLGQQIINGIFVQDNISYLSHIIGGIVGAGVGFGLSPKRQTSIFS